MYCTYTDALDPKILEANCGYGYEDDLLEVGNVLPSSNMPICMSV